MVLHLPGPAEVCPRLVELPAQHLHRQPLHDVGVRPLERLQHEHSVLRQLLQLLLQAAIVRAVLGRYRAEGVAPGMAENARN